MDRRGEPGRRTALIAGRCCAAAGWLLWVVMQVLAGDPFPPEISVSQYGLGPAGWVFTVWSVALAAAPLLLLHGSPVPGPARWMLRLGFVGALVMAVVRTDEGGGAMSWHAQLHMAGAVVALVFMPLGILFALRPAAHRIRRIADALTATAAVLGMLVVLSATGLDTAGFGATRSWALWQGALVVVEMLLVTVYAVAAGHRTPPTKAVGADD